MKNSIYTLMRGVAVATFAVSLAGCNLFGGGGGGGSVSLLDQPIDQSFNRTVADNVSGAAVAEDDLNTLAAATGTNVNVNGTNGAIVKADIDVSTNPISAVGGYADGAVSLNLNTAGSGGAAFAINANVSTNIGSYATSGNSGSFTNNEILLHRLSDEGNNSGKFILADIYYSSTPESTGGAGDDRFFAGGFWFALDNTELVSVSAGNITGNSLISSVGLSEVGSFAVGTPLDGYPTTGTDANKVNSTETAVSYTGDFAAYFVPNSHDSRGNVVGIVNGSVSFTANFGTDMLTGELNGLSGALAGVNLTLNATSWDTSNHAFTGANTIQSAGCDGDDVHSCAVGGSSFNGIFGAGGTGNPDVSTAGEPNYLFGTFGLNDLQVIRDNGGGVDAGDVTGIFDSKKEQ